MQFVGFLPKLINGKNTLPEKTVLVLRKLAVKIHIKIECHVTIRPIMYFGSQCFIIHI